MSDFAALSALSFKESPSFLKKRSKRLLLIWAGALDASKPQAQHRPVMAALDAAIHALLS